MKREVVEALHRISKTQIILIYNNKNNKNIVVRNPIIKQSLICQIVPILITKQTIKMEMVDLPAKQCGLHVVEMVKTYFWCASRIGQQQHYCRLQRQISTCEPVRPSSVACFKI